MAGGPLTPLLFAAAACGLCAIVGEERGLRGLVYVTKPTATLLLLAVAASASEAPPGYRWLVVTGLAASALGDVFLMLPRDRFVAGLASFLTAHVAYGAAFFTPPRAMADGLLLAGLLVVAAGIVAVLWPGLGSLRAPVLGYVAAIITMAWLACVRWRTGGVEGSGLAAAGALLFVVSDTLLAVDRFRRPIAHGRAFVLGTYYAAQALIAVSVTASAG